MTIHQIPQARILSRTPTTRHYPRSTRKHYPSSTRKHHRSRSPAGQVPKIPPDELRIQMQASMNTLGHSSDDQHGQLPTPLAWDPYRLALLQYSGLHMPPMGAQPTWPPLPPNPYLLEHLHGLHPHANSFPVAGPHLIGGGYVGAMVKPERCETSRRQEEHGKVVDDSDKIVKQAADATGQAQRAQDKMSHMEEI